MSRYRDLGLFVVLSLVWGTSFAAIEVGLDAFPPIQFAAFRLYIAATLLGAYVLLIEDDPWPKTGGDALAILAGGGLIIVVGSVFLFVGQRYTTSGVAAIVYSLTPVLTAVFGALLIGGTGLDVRDSVGVVLGVLGVGLVARPDPSAFDGDSLGVSLVFVAVVAVSLGGVFISRAETTISSLAVTAWSMAIGAVVTHGISVGFGESLMLVTALRPLIAGVYLATFSTALGYGLYFTLLRRIGPIQVNLISYVSPGIATILGWALLSERLSPLSGVGFAVIFVGFLVVKREAIRTELPRVRAWL